METDQSVRMELSRLGQTTWKAYLIRFVFGGIITAVAGLIAHAYGPVVGGLFLAFPAILPASVTLIEKHAGKGQAASNTNGAALGSAGLAAFGAVIWSLSTRLAPWLVLLLALAAWFAVSAGLWWLLRLRRHNS